MRTFSALSNKIYFFPKSNILYCMYTIQLINDDLLIDVSGIIIMWKTKKTHLTVLNEYRKTFPNMNKEIQPRNN